ncbi:vitamin B12 ABC transporter ATP-binding protein BtuD [Enterovibrio norvegicus FF-33]|uniref:Vitamin B12 import ATP-binding protein BtuD n=1 Tax=Enterovibrio norvegicus FF-454 TaxID=1185651 RepID=A0A1E5C9I1_9GAMM|nr:vitamin B12 ABC transporter ATP-binding protein BtuD [Enterovibrio norvegicus]OEE62135.1 vitamin B12 ABC transporter ATP-binding protein BtuD [Enterovibrio norvegicus FF-454]OEE65721.1 vitamin B12 ABC transporter ATP-binding protein BtuD [Enterovibrio norvegicus FF-33]OEE90113.1 vitamin B12 ABC transporter ATP-binding protein BtuD [Enterovibrio norvegicus FF-162]
MIEAKNIALGTRLLPLSFSVGQGEIVHLLGANGSGKSTLLELLSGLTEGQGNVSLNGIALADIDSKTLARQRAYLSQQQKPAFAIGVYQYLSLSLSALTKSNPIELDAAVKDICSTLRIEDKLNRNTEQLSGGEWQRVRLAGVCLQIWPDINPDGKLLILDEPASALDIAQQSVMYKMIRRIADRGIAVIMSNHDINRTLSDADRVMLLKNGHLVSQGSPREVMHVDTLEAVFGTRLRRVEIDGQLLMLNT